MSADSAAIPMPMSRRMRSPMRSSARWARAIWGDIFPIAILATKAPTASAAREVWKLASDRGFRLGNADVTIFAQKPKLAPYLDQMRINLARALDADSKLLNVKASSPEGLGALGRGDGMAAAAIIVLES